MLLPKTLVTKVARVFALRRQKHAPIPPGCIQLNRPGLMSIAFPALIRLTSTGVPVTRIAELVRRSLRRSLLNRENRSSWLDVTSDQPHLRLRMSATRSDWAESSDNKPLRLDILSTACRVDSPTHRWHDINFKNLVFGEQTRRKVASSVASIIRQLSLCTGHPSSLRRTYLIHSPETLPRHPSLMT